MLKACWDCLAGDRAANEDPYGTQMNILNGGTHRAPAWPKSQIYNENMFVLPRKLNAGDMVNIQGSLLPDRKSLIVSLITGYDVPDKSNIACQMEVDFHSNTGEAYEQISIKSVTNGRDILLNDNSNETQYFTSDDFSITFLVQEDQMLSIYAEESNVDLIKLNYNLENIRFLAVSGDVEKVKNLDFKFA